MRTLLSVIISAICLLSYATEVCAVEERMRHIPGHYLVRLKPTLSPLQQDHFRQRIGTLHGISTKKISTQMEIEQWSFPEGVDEASFIQALMESGVVEYIEPNYRRFPRQKRPNDPYFDKLWWAENRGQEINGHRGVEGADLALFDAWQLTTGSRSVKVALIDDGFDLYHPDLEANFDTLGGIDLRKGGLPLPEAGDYHGTLLAGVLGAVGDNQIGITGVAWDVQMLPIRFDFTVAQEIQAIDYALSQGVDLISISFGSSDFSKSEKDAFEKLYEAGVLVLVAAGNDGVNNDEVPDYPSNYSFPNIISVAASNPSDQLVSWSHYGLKKVDLMAPGFLMYSTDGAEGYRFVNGTSFSAPAVAGVASLIKAYHGQADWREIKARLFAGLDRFEALSPYLSAGGRVNAYRALTAPPQPVMTLADWKLKTAADDDSWVAGEEVDLVLTLENHWLALTGVRATLSSLSPLVSVIDEEVEFPPLSTGAISAGLESYTLRVEEGVVGHHRFPFELTIHHDQGESIVKLFNLEFGTLSSGVPTFGEIQQHTQDRVHSYWVTVPEGTQTLRFKTESKGNIDLIVRHAARPHYYFSSYHVETLSSELQDGTRSRYSVRSGGNEELNWQHPESGRYWVVVANTGEVPKTEYCLSVLMENPDDPSTLKALNPTLRECGDPPFEPPSSSSGGGGVGLFLIGVGAGLVRLKRRIVSLLRASL